MVQFILQITCSFLLAVGIFFALIDFRTKFDSSFRYFGISLALLSCMTGIDLWVLPALDSPVRTLHWTRIYHILACGYLSLTVRYILMLTHHNRPGYQKAVSYASAAFAVLFLTDFLLRLENQGTTSTIAYMSLFVPFVVANGAFLFYIIFSRLRKVETVERRILTFHLIGFLVMLIGGTLDMTVVLDVTHSLIPSYTIVGVLVYGIMATLIFTEKFLGVLKDKATTFSKLESAYRDLEQVNALKQIGESTAIINHEIKNYMFMISGNAQILGEIEHLSQKGKDIVQNIVTSVERLTVFSDDILKLSRTQVIREKHPINLTQLIRGTIDKHYPARRSAFTLIGMERDHFMFGDWGKMEQVFVNMFNNSFEAGQGRSVEIRVRITDAQSLLLVSVEDTGSGCTKEQLDSIFTAFYTTKKGQGGTGLGMSITRTIVESHGGKISAYSKNLARKDDHGLKLIMSFPVYAQNMAEEAQRKYPIVMIKEGMENLPDIIRVFQNVRVGPRIIQTAAELEEIDLPQDGMTILVSAKTMASSFALLSSYPRLCLVSHHQGNLYVLDHGRGNRPEIFSEEYVVSRLVRRAPSRVRHRERQANLAA